ncbi:WD40 repeat domain-containing protein [Actinosynnema sp. NPDC002837]
MDELQPARFDAFISYSHRSDGAFAPEFQEQLEVFARRSRRDRPLRVFRDDANLAADPDLWQGIERALSSSEWLLLLASPDAAESVWVGKEIEWWLAHRSPARILIGLTAGNLGWDAETGDFHSASDAAHPALRGVLPAEPRWIDLRGLRALPELDRGDPQVQDVIAEFSAPLRGVEKDELVGTHVRWLRRDRRRTRVIITVLVVLLVLASATSVVAYVQGQRANEQARVSTARLLAAAAVAASSTSASRARLLAVEGYRLHRDQQTVAALFQTVNDHPELVGQHELTSPVTALVASPSGAALAGTADGRLVRWDPATGDSAETDLGDRPVTDVAVSEDGEVAVATDDQRTVLWRVGTQPVALHQEQPGQVAVSPKGTTAAVLTSPTAEAQRLATFDTATTARHGDVALSAHHWNGLGFPTEDTIAVTGGAGIWQRLRLADLAVTISQEEYLAPPSWGLSATSDDGAFTGFLAGWALVYDTSTAQIAEHVSSAGGSYTPDVLAIRRDGERIASAGGGQLWVSEVATRDDDRAQRQLRGAGGADHVAFVGASDRLVTAKGGTLSFWDPDQQSRLRLDHGTLEVPESPRSGTAAQLAVSPDGRRALLVGGYGDVLLHDLDGSSASGTSVAGPAPGPATHEGSKPDVFPAWLPDGTPALIEQVGCGLHAIRGNRTERLLEGQGNRERAARLTPDGHLVCVSQYGGVSVRRLSDAMYVRNVETDLDATASVDGPAAISEGGRYAAWAGRHEDGVVRVTVADTQEEEIVSVLQTDAQAVDYAGDRLLVSHEDGSLDIRDGTGARLLRTVPGGTPYARPLSWVPGTPFVGRIRNDGALVLIDLDAGTTLGELRLPTSRASSAVAPWEATGIVGVGATGELLTATPHNTVSRWAVNEASWLDLACRSAARDLAAEEWRQVTDYDLPADLRCRR